jgi:hypothetical protein
VDIVLQQQARDVLGLLSRAKEVFGGEAPPIDTPAFIPPRNLEQDVGRGWC